MRKKYFFTFTFFSLIISGLVAQQSHWDTLSFYKMKENYDYSRNFNPIDFNPEVLRACVLEMINYVRDINPEHRAGKLSTHPTLDSAASIQATYMASREERTTENKGIHKNTYRRIKLHGGTQFVDEVVSRTKASDPREHYSYIDLSKSMLLPILNNRKNSIILLDKKYSYAGISYEFDENSRNIYFSIVLGNDRTLNPAADVRKRKELSVPYTTKKHGLTSYDTRNCRRCEEVRNIEAWRDGLKIENDEIIFEFDNIRNFRRVIGRSKDALAVDIVMKEQYKCNDENILNNDKVNRGYMIKPMFAGKIQKKNQITDRKSRKLRVSFGELPREIEGDFELNLMIIKEKSVCRSIQKMFIEKSNLEHAEKLRFVKDISSIATPTYVPVEEQATIELIVPFQANKHSYRYEDIEPFIKALREPKFDVDSLVITAYTSLEGSNKANEELQRKRAESIVQAIDQQQKRRITYKTKTSDSWELFKRDVKNTKHAELASMSFEQAKQELKGKKLKDLEPMLSKHRFARIVMNITYDISGRNEQEFVINKFNNAVKAGDLKLAMSIQKYIIKSVEAGNYNRKIISDMNIPVENKNIALLLNYYYLQNFFLESVNDAMCQGVDKVLEMDSKNIYAFYDNLVCKISNLEFSNENEIRDLQSEVDKIYSMKIDKTKADALNLELQFKILEYADTTSSQTMEQLLETTYAKVKDIVNIESNTWMNAYKLATVFIEHGDYQYAELLMAPFIYSDEISQDFLFTYFSLYSYREELYLSSTFAELAKRCLAADKARFCTLMGKFSFQVRENLAAKKIYCDNCQ
ncbi:MAG: hypothetical protein RBS19_02290 [Bacteroidales bacterium]|nr:hypothetical protein [Bacteroidales bacterium]